jgi:RNA polymerase sigma-70 factor (ECF subfamily)
MEKLNVEDLHRKYSAMVYSIGLKGTRNRQAAEDVRQQVFVSVFKSLGKFRHQCQLKTWIHQIALNECYQYRLKEWREYRKINAYLASRSEAQDEESDWDNRLLVEKVLGLADPETLRILEITYTRDLPQGQIAKAVGVSRITVAKRLSRFREIAGAALRAD